MDTITHALSGALLARATGCRTPATTESLDTRTRLLAGALAAAFPDIDFVIRFLFDALTYLNTHRGVTHSLILMPLWAWLLAVLFARLFRTGRPWQAYYTVSLMGIAIHIAGDVITAYGTMVFSPISLWRAIAPTTFIIDPYFTTILIAGLLLSRYRQPERTAQGALAVLCLYVGMQGILHQVALGLGETHATQAGMTEVRIRALPQPLSPFNWKIVISDDSTYHIAHVDLLRSDIPSPPARDAGFFSRLNAVYRPHQALEWQRLARFGDDSAQQDLILSAWRDKGFASFRRFAVLPVLYRVDAAGGPHACVWFTDLRFVIGGMTPPFRFGMCREDTVWTLRRLSRLSP